MLRNRTILLVAVVACLLWSVTALASDTPRYRHGDKNRADGIINTLAGSEDALGQTAGERTFGAPLAVSGIAHGLMLIARRPGWKGVNQRESGSVHVLLLLSYI